MYCLEHTLPGPGENISSGGQQPKGPYQIVDMDSYLHTPGNSKVIYHESTMHAIAWVLRHTYYEAEPEDRNLATMIDMLGQMETREDDEDFANPVDQMFELLEQDKPRHFAVRQYKKFKLAAGMTLCIGHLTHTIMSEMITI